MHELAHLLLGHEPSTVFFAGQENLALRGFNKAAEEEADWLAGALLLPRDALVRLRAQNRPKDVACDEFGVSRRMMEFRMRVHRSRAAVLTTKEYYSQAVNRCGIMARRLAIYPLTPLVR